MMVKRKQYKSSAAKQSISTEEGLAVARKVVREAQKNQIDCALCGGLAMHWMWIS